MAGEERNIEEVLDELVLQASASVFVLGMAMTQAGIPRNKRRAILRNILKSANTSPAVYKKYAKKGSKDGE